jgi:hypothetical protein
MLNTLRNDISLRSRIEEANEKAEEANEKAEEANEKAEEANERNNKERNNKYNKLLRKNGEKALNELIEDIEEGDATVIDLSGLIKYYIKKENITILDFYKVYNFFNKSVQDNIQDKELLSDIKFINDLYSDNNLFLERLITDLKLTISIKDKDLLKEIVFNTLMEENIIEISSLENIMKNTKNKGSNLQKSLNNISDFISSEKKKELIIILKDYKKSITVDKKNGGIKI